MNLPPRSLRINEPLRSGEANRITEEVFRSAARQETDAELVPDAADADSFLARIISAATPANGRRAYAYTLVRELSDGRVVDAPQAPGGTTTFHPAYEEEGNPHVPLDGSAIVWMKPGEGGNYHTFNFKRRPVWAELTGSSGALYAWVEKYPSSGGTWTTLSGGMSGTTSVNPARERNGVTGIANGTVVKLDRGYSSGWPQIVTNRTQPGDSDSVPEVHSLKVLRATGGTYTLTFEGQTTGSLAYNANAAAIEAALEALSNLTAVSVSGTGTENDPFLVEYQDDFDTHEILTYTSSLLGDQEWLFDNSCCDRIGTINLTADQTAWDLSDYDRVQVIPDTDGWLIKGIAGGWNGRQIIIWNRTNYLFTLVHQSGDASAVDRISTNGESGAGEDLVIDARSMAILTWWNEGSRWYVKQVLNFCPEAEPTNARMLVQDGYYTKQGYILDTGEEIQTLHVLTFQGSNPVAPTGSVTSHAFDPTHALVGWQGGGANATIHGLAPFTSETPMLLVTLASATGETITFKHQSGTANPGEEIIVATGQDFVMEEGDAAVLFGNRLLPLKGLGGGAVADANYGDITVSGTGTSWQINAGAVDTNELADDAVTLGKIDPGAGLTGTL